MLQGQILETKYNQQIYSQTQEMKTEDPLTAGTDGSIVLINIRSIELSHQRKQNATSKGLSHQRDYHQRDYHQRDCHQRDYQHQRDYHYQRDCHIKECKQLHQSATKNRCHQTIILQASNKYHIKVLPLSDTSKGTPIQQTYGSHDVTSRDMGIAHECYKVATLLDKGINRPRGCHLIFQKSTTTILSRPFP